VSGGFEQICWATEEEWAAVASILASFNEISAPPPTPPTSSTLPILRLGESWIDDELQRLPSVAEILDANGWQQAGSDSYGTHWVRPGKDPREGHSASVSHDAGRLWVHSTNAGLQTSMSMDALDLLWALRNHGQVPTAAERVEFLRALRPVRNRDAGAGPVADTVPAPASLNLPDEFWQQPKYPFLAHIRTAALARRLSPDAVWEAIKCFYGASIPWNHRLPSNGTMDYMSIVVGASGAGKSRAKSEAFDLLCGLHIDGVAFPVPPGSGEGMAEVFLDRSKDSPAKYAYRGLGFYVDEGKWLLDVANRMGNTTMQSLKQLWSGELTGSVAATAERHRWLAPRDVRATVLVSTTPDIAAQFLRADLTDEGLPQRISWGWAHYPHPDEKPDHPGPLSVQAWRPTENVYELDIASELQTQIDAQMLAQSRGELPGEHEGHSTYARLKTAAILAHLRGHMDVTMLDWELSCLDWDCTRRIRSYLLASQTKHASEKNTQIGEARAYQRLAETNVYLERAALSLVTKIRAADHPLSFRDIKDHLRSFSKRHGVDFREVIHTVVQRGLVIGTDEGYVTP
jgi:hypothetical protein